MPLDLDDTIAAIASAPGGAARGIVRISGPRAIACLRDHFRPRDDAGGNWGELRAATAIEGDLTLSDLHSPLPCTLFIWPNARSYTRQPVVEVHTLGSPPLLQLLLRNVCAGGARPAEPGEFTLRAFLAGRLDLTQAEAVLGLIDARHERDFDVALAQLAGGLSGPLTALRDGLLDLLARLEAGLDFVEEDIEFIAAEELQRELAAAAATVAALAKQLAARGDATERARVVLCGWPNVGKSRLFNALAGSEGALVSPQAGTTRDYLAADLALPGMTCRLIDTAGVEPRGDQATIGALAQQFRAEQHERAQLQVLCLDSTRPLNVWERAELGLRDAAARLIVLTKIDGPRRIDLARPDAIETSAATGQGLDLLRRALSECLAATPGERGAVAATAVRCAESLRLAAECLTRAGQLVATVQGHELVAAEVRVALDELGKVVGAVYTDDLLDRIFSRFCIGK